MSATAKLMGELAGAERGIKVGSQVMSVFNAQHRGEVIALCNSAAWVLNTEHDEAMPWTYDINALILVSAAVEAAR